MLWDERNLLIKRFYSAQKAQIKTHNNKISFKHFKVKNKMILFTRNLKNARFKKKLFYKFIEFFEIKKVVDFQTYYLRLSDQWKIHFVFYVFFFKSYYINANIVPSTEMILVSEDQEYKVKDILKNKKKWEKPYYLVRWKKFSFCKNSWILKHYLANAQNMLKCYYKRESFITVMFKIKKLRFWTRKEDFSKEE